MNYVGGIIVFLLALALTVVAVGQLRPRGLHEWMRRSSWGREIVGLTMFGIGAAVSDVVFRRVS